MKNTLVFVLTLLSTCLFSQTNSDSPKLLSQESAKINQINEGLAAIKGSGYKPDMRYLNTIEKHVVDGKVDNYSKRITDAFEAYQRTSNNADAIRWGSTWSYYAGDNLSFQAPVVEIDNYNWYGNAITYQTTGGWSPGVGRINCIAFHPSNSQTFFVGTAHGGIWKTTNAGTNWTNITNNLPNISISDIVIEENTPDKIYVLTGDYDGKYQPSIGLYKSYNGGSSWGSTGLSFNQNQVAYCGDVKINPNDPSQLMVACTNGLYRSTNYGSNFSLQSGNSYTDVEFHPTNSDSIYAADLCKIYRFDYSSSSNVSITTLYNYNCTGSEAFRTELCVTPYYPDVLMSVSSRVLTPGGNSDRSMNNFMVSTDAGDNFQERSGGSPNMMNSSFTGSGSGGQGGYDIDVECVPTDTSTVYIGGVNVWKSTNGGFDWDIETYWRVDDNNAPYVHADIHDIEFNGGSKPFICSDGGLHVRHAISDIYYDKTNDMGINQFYDIAITNQDINRVIGALQDNGISYTSANGEIKQVRGADGMAVMYDHYDNNKYYTCRQNGYIEVTTDNGLTWNKIQPSFGSNSFPFVTDYVIHPTDSNILFGAGNNLYRTMDGGATDWTVISVVNSNLWITNVDIGKNDPTIVYLSQADKIWRVTNALGANPSVTNITGTLPANQNNLPITNITVNPSDADELFVTFGGYSSTQKVYTSDDGGNTWTNFSTGLPNVPMYTLTYEDGSNQTLYVGTELGVYYSEAGGDWLSFNAGLPLVRVNDIEINYNTREMYAGTWGRGIWGRDLSVANCPDTINLTIATDPDPQGNTMTQTYDAEQRINSTRVVEGNNANVQYNAKNKITLLPGFKAKVNSTFKAILKDCN